LHCCKCAARLAARGKRRTFSGIQRSGPDAAVPLLGPFTRTMVCLQGPQGKADELQLSPGRIGPQSWANQVRHLSPLVDGSSQAVSYREPLHRLGEGLALGLLLHARAARRLPVALLPPQPLRFPLIRWLHTRGDSFAPPPCWPSFLCSRPAKQACSWQLQHLSQRLQNLFQA